VANLLKQYQLEKPIWVAETGISSFATSPITPAYSSTDEQAADVWRRLCLLWAKGAQVVFWHTGWSNGDLGGWGEFGLINVQGRKKKSFHAYRLLTEKVGRFSAVGLVQQGEVTDDNTVGGSGVWVVYFVVEGRNKWVMWSPDRRPYTLEGLKTDYFTVTQVVPTLLLQSGDSAVFSVQTYSPNNGTFLFGELPPLPILVEEIASSAVPIVNPQLSLALYPNPAEEVALVRIVADTPLPFRLEVCDVLQRKVFDHTVERSAAGEQTVRIDLSGWPVGVYLCRLSAGPWSAVRILVKK
jgi:hypothetical protein